MTLSQGSANFWSGGPHSYIFEPLRAARPGILKILLHFYCLNVSIFDIF